MKWMVLLLGLLTTSPAIATELAHTGEPCQKYQSLKKEHPSQRIYYETTTTGKRCYHLHAKEDHASGLPAWTLTKGASFPKSRMSEVLNFSSIPNMMWFYNDYTRGRNFEW